MTPTKASQHVLDHTDNCPACSSCNYCVEGIRRMHEAARMLADHYEIPVKPKTQA